MGSGGSRSLWPPGTKPFQAAVISTTARISQSKDAEMVPGVDQPTGNSWVLYGQDNRAISTGKLNALPRLHTRPINVVVYHGASPFQEENSFRGGFLA